MPKLTLLDMTQNILSAMDSDNVSSIDDTIESQQVAEIVKESYFDICSSRDWPFLRTSFQLTASGDTDYPTRMSMPETCNKLDWIKYNKKDVSYLDPKEFQDMLDVRVEEVDVVDANGFCLTRDPLYWTTFDDSYIFFDSYDATTESTLQSSKAKAYGISAPSWTHEDSFIPSLPEKMFPTLLADAKGTAFLNLKQQPNQKEERRAQRGKTVMRNEAWRANEGEGKYNRKVNYGRNR